MSCVLPQKTQGQQGIKGQVVWLEGNLMPSVGEEPPLNPKKGKPVQRTLFLYEATEKDQTVPGKSAVFYNQINSKLVKKVATEEDGSFKVNLPPGKYSIFVLEEDGYFASTFDGQGIINPVIVEPQKYTEIVIEINYKAAY
jgi:hypothetical protein